MNRKRSVPGIWTMCTATIMPIPMSRYSPYFRRSLGGAGGATAGEDTGGFDGASGGNNGLLGGSGAVGGGDGKRGENVRLPGGSGAEGDSNWFGGKVGSKGMSKVSWDDDGRGCGRKGIVGTCHAGG